jgi:hypothetical protein
MTLDEKKKIFEDGIEKGRAESKKDLDEVWEMYFDLVSFVDDVNGLVADAVEALESNPTLEDEFPDGWVEFAKHTIEFADSVTSLLYEDDGLPEEDDDEDEEEDEFSEV